MNILAIVADQLKRNRDGFMGRLQRNSQRQERRADQEIGCLLWTAAKNNCDYPTMNFRFNGRHFTVCVHHVTFALFTGREMPKGHERDHTCNTSHCIEPRHMEAVTHLENCKRRGQRAMLKWSYADAVAQMEGKR